MPSFTTIVTTEVEVDFEVFCGTCGEGLCRQSKGRQSRSRSYPQVEVEVCQKCIASAEEPLKDQIHELSERIAELENDISELTAIQAVL